MADLRRDQVADLAGRLVAIDSVNPDLVPGAAGETALASFVAGWLDDAGLEAELLEPEPGRPSVVATLRGGGGRSLMLNAHLDTVGVAGMADPFEPPSGVAAHGSRPDLGVDAITKMGRVLVGLEDLAARLPTGAPHPLLGHGSVHASLIEGGREMSTYPDRCVLKVERRTLPGETPDSIRSELQAIVGESGDVRVLLAREPSEVSAAEPIVRAVREAATGRLGAAAGEIGASYWMDAAILTGAGIPTVTLGPAGEGAHALIEWVDLESVQACAEIYVAAARSFCG